MAVGSSNTMHLRLHRHHACNGHTLLLTARQLVGGMAAVCRHTYRFQARHSHAAISPRWHTDILRPEPHVFLHNAADDLVVRFWNTMPAVCRISQRFSSSLLSLSPIQTVPSVGISSAFICLASVDLGRAKTPQNHITTTPRRVPLLPLSILFSP